MNALRIICLLLAFGVLGVVGWRSGADHGPAQPVRVAAGGARLPASSPPEPLPPLASSAPPREAETPVLPVPAPPTAAPPEAAPPPALPAASVASPVPSTPAAPPSIAAPQDRLTDVPEFAAFFDRLKLDFPHDYIAIVRHLDQGGAEATGANAAIWAALRDLEQSRGILAAQAAPPALDRFFEARSAVLDGLAPLDARQCADFLYGVTDAALADFTAAHRGLVATLADRTLEAIADGRDHPAERSTPTPADLDALAAGLAARGLSPAEVGFLMDGTAPDPPLADTRVCAIGRTYLDVLHGLPAEARQRIYGLAAELLARS
jgi:hypothetical protein